MLIGDLRRWQKGVCSWENMHDVGTASIPSGSGVPLLPEDQRLGHRRRRRRGLGIIRMALFPVACG